jgi:hypothetical protein
MRFFVPRATPGKNAKIWQELEGVGQVVDALADAQPPE